MKYFFFCSLLLSLFSCVDNTQKKFLGDLSFQVEVSFYDGKSDKDIIIMPPTGGANLIDRSYAKALSKNGFNVSIIEHWTNDDEKSFELSIHKRFYARAQKAIETVLQDIPSQHTVAILGTSVGGLHSAIALGKLPRISTGFLITAGADITTIIVNSDQNAMKKAKKKRMVMYDFKNDEQYILNLREVIELEPLNYPDALSKKKIGMVVSTADTTVPYHNQELLVKAAKPDFLSTYDVSHFWTIVRFWLFSSDEVVSFFKSKM